MNTLPVVAPNHFPLWKLFAFLLMITVLGILIWIGWQWNSAYHFDRSIWLAHAHEGGDNPRLKMVSDLRANYLHPGKTQKEVVALLGMPEQEEKGDAKEIANYLPPAEAARIDHTCGYRLGAPWFDDVDLYIGFDKTDRLVGTWKVQY